MPIFEYECLKCSKTFDLIVLKSSEADTPKCSECGSADVRKLVSRVRYAAGPKQNNLASGAESRLLKMMGGNVSDSTKKEVKELSELAAKRGKKRFDSMMDTGKSESVDY